MWGAVAVVSNEPGASHLLSRLGEGSFGGEFAMACWDLYLGLCDLVQSEGPSSGIVLIYSFHSSNQTDFLLLFKYLYLWMCVIALCLGSSQSTRGNKEQTISVP